MSKPQVSEHNPKYRIITFTDPAGGDGCTTEVGLLEWPSGEGYDISIVVNGYHRSFSLTNTESAALQMLLAAMTIPD